MTWTTEKPKTPGWYWVRGETRHNAIAHIGERIVWDNVRCENVSHGWWAQLTPGGVSLPLAAFTNYEFSGPIPEPGATIPEGDLWTLLTEEMTRQYIAGELAELMVPTTEGLVRADRLRAAGAQDWHRAFHAMGSALLVLEKMGYRVTK